VLQVEVVFFVFSGKKKKSSLYHLLEKKVVVCCLFHSLRFLPLLKNKNVFGGRKEFFQKKR